MIPEVGLTQEGVEFPLVPAGHFILQERAPVLIVGPCGTGKSHLAQALGHCAIRQGVDVLFITQGDLVGSLHAARATGGFDRRFRQLAKVTLLIIDDFGLKPMRPPHDEDFHDLIAERYERVSTMLTSNLDFVEWGDVFPANRMLGVATLDRLRHGAYRLILEGDSFRAPRPLPESPKNTLLNTVRDPISGTLKWRHYAAHRWRHIAGQ